MPATPRSFFSGVANPASASPFQASESASPSVKAISPRPAWSRLRFSADALVDCTETLASGSALPNTWLSATPIG